MKNIFIGWFIGFIIMVFLSYLMPDLYKSGFGTGLAFIMCMLGCYVGDKYNKRYDT